MSKLTANKEVTPAKQLKLVKIVQTTIEHGFFMHWPTCKWHSNANSFAINDNGKSEKNVFCKTLNILSS